MVRRRWTNEEIEILKKFYPEGESEACIGYIDRNKKCISKKARELGLKSLKFNTWSTEEDEKLKFHWKHSTMKELINSFPNRTYNSLMLRAQFLGIKSEIKRKRKGSLEFLNKLTPNSYYWWGFIIADGHLTKKGELVIGLDIKDQDHLKKLSNHLFCSISNRKSICSFSGKERENCILRIQDKFFGDKWLKLLEINSPKTYTPPNLTVFLSKESLINFFIGLVDGDGCIWESKGWPNLKIELHKNWLPTLQLISDKLQEFYSIRCKVFTSKRGTSNLVINTKKDLEILKNYINNLDYLERKWSKLDMLQQKPHMENLWKK